MSGKTVRDMLAAAGVTASLIFVGVELRQSNAQARAAAYQAIGTATAEAFDTWAHDPDFNALWLKDPAEMDAVEWRQLAAKFTGFARLGEMVLLQIEQEVLDEDAMRRLGYSGWRGFLGDPKLACLWPLIEPDVSDEFRGFVEEGHDPDALDCTAYTIQ